MSTTDDRKIGEKFYDLKDHLGNVSLTLNDYKFRQNINLGEVRCAQQKNVIQDRCLFSDDLSTGHFFLPFHQ